MKIVNILGGLGNQMFVYAMYLALRTVHPNEDIFLSRRSYKGYPLHNGYELDRSFFQLQDLAVDASFLADTATHGVRYNSNSV